MKLKLIGSELNMHINIHTPIDKLLELWVKYSHRRWEKSSFSSETIKEMNEIEKNLSKHGIFSLKISAISEESYKISYYHKGSWVDRSVPLIK